MVTPNNASKWQMRFNSAFKGLITRGDVTARRQVVDKGNASSYGEIRRF